MFKKFIKYYLPAIIWAGIIFYLSSRPGLRYFSENSKEIFLRKGAHFAEFSVLAILLWRIFFVAHNIKKEKAYGIVLVLAIAYGFSDEWHQTFVFGRTGKIIDAVFDSASVVLMLELILAYVKKKITLKNILILFCSVLVLAGLEFKMIQDGYKTQNNTEVKKQNDTEIIETQKDAEENGTTQKIQNNIEEKIPDKILVKVPFTTQAPFSKWDEIHEEACEEASIVMLEYYFTGKKLTREIAESEIQALVAFQKKKVGDFKDTTAQQTADLFLDFYGEIEKGKKLKVVYDFDKVDLKKYLARGNPIIIPAAGRELGNPNFTAPGPFYHNLVLVGYDGDTIITNDPGTRKGERYKYNLDILYNAIHDFPGKPENIKQGRKAMIVVE
ncbi:MAG: VanZ family protein [bacterium]|nr:VanZ family protein [bacterium]